MSWTSMKSPLEWIEAGKRYQWGHMLLPPASVPLAPPKRKGGIVTIEVKSTLTRPNPESTRVTALVTMRDHILLSQLNIEAEIETQ